MLKGPGENLVISIRFSVEQKKQNKLFSLFTTFFELLQNWHKTQLSLFSIASKLNWALVCFFVSAIIRSGGHVKSQIRISSLFHKFFFVKYVGQSESELSCLGHSRYIVQGRFHH